MVPSYIQNAEPAGAQDHRQRADAQESLLESHGCVHHCGLNPGCTLPLAYKLQCDPYRISTNHSFETVLAYTGLCWASFSLPKEDRQIPLEMIIILWLLWKFRVKIDWGDLCLYFLSRWAFGQWWESCVLNPILKIFKMKTYFFIVQSWQFSLFSHYIFFFCLSLFQTLVYAIWATWHLDIE